MRELSKLLKERREALGIPQKAFAADLGWLSGQYISNIERGLCPFPLESIKKASKILDLAPAKIRKAFIMDAANEIDGALE